MHRSNLETHQQAFFTEDKKVFNHSKDKDKFLEPLKSTDRQTLNRQKDDYISGQEHKKLCLRRYTKEELNLFYSYLQSTTFYKKIRAQNKHIPIFTTEEKRSVLNSAYADLCTNNVKERLDSLKEELESHQEKIVVLVLHGKIYFKHEVFQADATIVLEKQESLQSFFDGDCVCITLILQRFQKAIKCFNYAHFKKINLMALLFDKIGFSITKSVLEGISLRILHLEFKQCGKYLIDMKKVTKPRIYPEEQISQFSSVKVPAEDEIGQPGVFLLISGTFELLNELALPITELHETYAGEESFWGQHKYSLRQKTFEGSVFFLSKQSLIRVLQSKYQKFVELLRVGFDRKQQFRNETQAFLRKTSKFFDRSKASRLKTKTSMKGRQLCHSALENLKKTKPEWLKSEEAERKQSNYKKRNMYPDESAKCQKYSKRYFSVRQHKNNSVQIQKFKNKFFSEEKRRETRSFNTPEKKRPFSSAEGLVNYSKASNVGFFTPQRPKEDTMKEKVKSQPQLKYDKTSKWDLEYSEFYDRELSLSLKKEKHLNMAIGLKNKLCAKKKLDLFTLDDAIESQELTFYQIEKLKRQNEAEKEKRLLQKTFKAKLLTTYGPRGIPFSSR